MLTRVNRFFHKIVKIIRNLLKQNPIYSDQTPKEKNIPSLTTEDVAVEDEGIEVGIKISTSDSTEGQEVLEKKSQKNQ